MITRHVNTDFLKPTRYWLPWWFRPSSFLLFVMFPAMVIFSLSDPTLTLGKAQLFYGNRDFVVGVIAFAAMIIGARLGEAGILSSMASGLVPGVSNRKTGSDSPRLAEALLSENTDRFIMGIFLLSHLIFFRDFFTNPGLIGGILGGDLEIKKTLKTIPGITTWTQVSLVLGALRGLRWAGILPGNVKLISVFHLTFFGVLFVRAVLWSERLALIEGIIPFFLCATPKLGRLLRPAWRQFLNYLPLVMPLVLLLVFVFFEALRSWQSNTAQHANLFVFGWKRLFTYYFEAMNTGAATLGVTGFYDGLTLPISNSAYEVIYNGLYQGPLDPEFNNTSGIWYLGCLTGNALFIPILILAGFFTGTTFKSFREGRLYGLLYPIQFLGMMEIIRIYYWCGTNQVLASTVVILVLLGWSFSLAYRIRRVQGAGHLHPVSTRC